MFVVRRGKKRKEEGKDSCFVNENTFPGNIMSSTLLFK